MLSNYVAGFGDRWTFGGTAAIRDAWYGDPVDKESGAYFAGEGTADISALAIGELFFAGIKQAGVVGLRNAQPWVRQMFAPKTWWNSGQFWRVGFGLRPGGLSTFRVAGEILDVVKGVPRSHWDIFRFTRQGMW